MHRYRVPRSIPDNFGAPMRVLLHLIGLINSAKPNAEIIVDFSKCQFANPFHLTVISMLVCRASSNKVPVKISVEGLTNTFIQSYLSTIQFPTGLDTTPETAMNDIQFEIYNSKTYIPIVRFPANSLSPNETIRERLLEFAAAVIKNQLKLKGDFLNAVKYFISELTNNVSDHSKGDYGYMFAQYFPQKLYMDFCVVDDGINIFNSFAESEFYHPSSHIEAIEMAVNGRSTKKGQENSRGFGISTSRRMLVQGLGGRFFLWSGAACYLEQQGKLGAGSFELKEIHAFPGTFVGLRIPLNPDSSFKFYNYLE